MKKLIILLLIVFLIFVFLYAENNIIEITRYSIENEKITEDLSGYKIIQVSDLHNKDFGNQIVNKIKRENPDMIVLTGDLIDSHHPDVDVAFELVEELIEIAPVYYVDGNHEERFLDIEKYHDKYENLGVRVLINEKIEIIKDNSSFTLIGIQDPVFSDWQTFNENLEYLTQNNSDFSLMLTHHPEYFQIYSLLNVDLILSGHAHGGQFRIPIINKPLWTPWEGLFPRYAQGIHQENDTTMIVNRGLGASLCPIRLFNRPELVVITLTKVQNNEAP